MELVDWSVFVQIRASKALDKGELVFVWQLLRTLDPLPSPFDTVLARIYFEKLNEAPYKSRLAKTLRMCLRTLRRGYFSVY